MAYLSPLGAALTSVLPTFALIGAMKAGTTSISTALDDHPAVFVCSPKEPQFFTTRWERGLGWYESLFDPAGAALARGDASTSYTDFPRKPEAVERMAAVVPDIKLVYLVRDPIARIRSHYRHRVADGNETRPVEVALLDDRYVLRSCYALQLEQYLKRFDREQILVLQSEDLLAGESRPWTQLFEFIGVPAPAEPPTLELANSAEARLRLRPGARNLRHRVKASAVYRMAPHQLKATARRLGTRAQSDNDGGVISPQLQAQLETLLADDMARLAELTGISYAAR